jgi:hypothetical protein
MSKSTPLSQLNSQEEMSNGNAYNEKENQLVNEILTEINNNESAEDTQNLLMELNEPVERPVERPVEQAVERPLEQAVEQAGMKHEQTPSREQLTQDFNLTDEDEENSLSSVQDEIISRIKMPLLAGALVVLFSTPQVTQIISKLIPTKEIFLRHKTLFSLVAKFILSTIVFTGVQFAV